MSVIATDPLQGVLAQLQGVKQTGDKQWQARCPAHADRVASLSIGVGDDDRILIHCQAGCEAKAIVAALGMELRDLFADNRNAGASTKASSANGRDQYPLEALATHEHKDANNSKAGKTSANGKARLGKIVATYDYNDAAGTLLFQTVRYDPKDFRQRRPNGDGGWIWNLKGVQRVLYRLPALLASDPAELVYLVEGEKDADALAALGLVATTAPQGAGKFKHVDATPLKGRLLAIIPDRDEAGEKHVQDAAARLAGVATEMRVVRLPAGKDAAEFIEARDSRTAEEIATEIGALADAAEIWSPPEPNTEDDADDAPIPDGKSPVDTDCGNSERFIKQHGDRVLWCPEYGWLVWDRRRWRREDSSAVVKLGKRTARAILTEATRAEGRMRTRLLAHWKRSENRSRVEAMVALAKPEVAVEVEKLDANSMLFNVANVTIDLETGKARQHDRRDRITKLSRVKYDPAATCPTVEKFLSDIFCGRGELVEFYWRLLGYSLTGETTDQGIYILHGSGANGKTQLLITQRALFGDYCMNTAAETFMQQRTVTIREDIARLVGARVVTSIETEEGRRLAEKLIKTFSGEDPVSARFLYCATFEFVPSCKIYLACNHRPIVRGTDYAIWRRIRLIPFDWTVPVEDRVAGFAKARLLPELSGVLNRALRGCRDWQRGGLNPPECVQAATAEYRAESDMLAEWIEERCNIGQGQFASNKTLRKSYEAWAEDNGCRTMDGTWFGRRLADRDGLTRGKECGARGWHGISVREWA